MGTFDSLTEQLKTVVTALQDCRVEYALAGGLAYSALVEPRATLDIDVLILFQKLF